MLIKGGMGHHCHGNLGNFPYYTMSPRHSQFVLKVLKSPAGKKKKFSSVLISGLLDPEAL